MKLLVRIILTIFLWHFCHTGYSQEGLGYPIWPIAGEDAENIQLIDWTTTPPEVRSVPGTGPCKTSGIAAGFDLCGNLVFIVNHTGIPNVPYNTYIYAADGTPLLTNFLPNAPGLNGERLDYEIQVVKVPNSLNQWYIFYKEWKPDAGAPFGGAGRYTPAPILYTKIEYDHKELTILERDVELEVNGTAYTYINSLAVSAKGPDTLTHYFYVCRRSAGYDYISLDRFILDENGITFDKNTGDIANEWWYLCIHGSLLEVSQDGNRILCSSRNEEVYFTDFFLFDANLFSNDPGAYQRIVADDLVLQPDGVYLNDPMNIGNVGQNIEDLYFVRNFSRKLNVINFSPDGNYVFIGQGGYVSSGNTNITYMGQIYIGPYNNPAPYPYSLRMKIQSPPGPYDPYSGEDGSTALYNDMWNYPVQLQTAYNGQVYFAKRAESEIFVIPDPNSPITNDLKVTEISFANTAHQNIPLEGHAFRLPDQIDGYDYDPFDPVQVDLGDNVGFCAGQSAVIDAGDGFLSYTWSTGSYEQEITVQDSGWYWVEVMDEHGCFSSDTVFVMEGNTFTFSLGNDTSICEGDSAVLTMPLTGLDFHWQDGSTDPVYIAWHEGWYWVEAVDSGCTGYDSIYVSFRDNPQPDLGDNAFFCAGGDVTLDPGTFVSYLWQDNSTEPTYTASETGLYWVEVSDGFCLGSDSITMYERANPFPYLGPDTTICRGYNILLDPGNYESYLWSNNATGEEIYASEEGPYWVKVSDGYCEGSDTIFVFLEDCGCTLHFPNCFTPNNDGINDTFYGKGHGIDDLDLFIYNRWGQQVFEGNGFDKHWDGKYKSQLCAQGVYYFVAFYRCIGDIGNEKSKTAKGSVTLLRE